MLLSRTATRICQHLCFGFCVLSNPVNLFSLSYDFNQSKTMVVLHGLMGSSKNFRSICKNSKISSYVNCSLVDVRNHGNSPHAQTHTMQDLADDLHQFLRAKQLEFVNDRSWEQVTLLGHSMGAVALMAFTERYPECQDFVSRVILVDIPCCALQQFKSANQTYSMLQRMNALDLKRPTKQVFQSIDDKIFRKDIAGLFKMSIRVISDTQHEWIPNLPTLVKEYRHLAQYCLKDNQWRKPVEVIYGTQSEYVNSEQIQLFMQRYPQMQRSSNFYPVEGGGHWVHFDRTAEFLSAMQAILLKDDSAC